MTEAHEKQEIGQRLDRDFLSFDAELQDELDQAAAKAIDSLARYKFLMFGYWAGIWVHLNRIGRFKNDNPFRNLVTEARRIRDGKEFDEWDPWEAVVRSHKDFQVSTYTGGINELGVCLRDGAGEANFHGPNAWTQAATFLGFNISPDSDDDADWKNGRGPEPDPEMFPGGAAYNDVMGYNDGPPDPIDQGDRYE